VVINPAIANQADFNIWATIDVAILAVARRKFLAKADPQTLLLATNFCIMSNESPRERVTRHRKSILASYVALSVLALIAVFNI
jgi:hypothetical protein